MSAIIFHQVSLQRRPVWKASASKIVHLILSIGACFSYEDRYNLWVNVRHKLCQRRFILCSIGVGKRSSKWHLDGKQPRQGGIKSTHCLYSHSLLGEIFEHKLQGWHNTLDSGWKRKQCDCLVHGTELKQYVQTIDKYCLLHQEVSTLNVKCADRCTLWQPWNDEML